LVVLCCSTAWAQSAEKESTERTRADLDEALEAIHRLENRVEALAGDVGRLSRAQALELAQALEEMRQRMAPPKRVSFGWDDGAYFQVPHFRLRLNAGALALYSGVVRPGAASTSSFQVPRAQVALTGSLDEWLDLHLMLDFGAQFIGPAGFSGLRDAYAEVRPWKWLSIRGGQFKVPFSRQRLVSSLRQTFIDRAVSTRALSFDRDLGGMVEGRFFSDRWRVQLSITDGVNAGPEVINNNLDLAYTVRTVVTPFGADPLVEGDRLRSHRPMLALGAAFQYDLQPDLAGMDVDQNGVVDNVEVISFNAEATLHYYGFALEAEYFLRRERPGFARPNAFYHGGHVQASAMIWRGLQVGTRFAYADPHLFNRLAPPVGIWPGPNPLNALEAGWVINYFVWGEQVKIQGGYTYQRDTSRDPLEGRTVQGHRLEVQLAAGF
jgi:hypothetical protein